MIRISLLIGLICSLCFVIAYPDEKNGNETKAKELINQLNTKKSAQSELTQYTEIQNNELATESISPTDKTQVLLPRPFKKPEYSKIETPNNPPIFRWDFSKPIEYNYSLEQDLKCKSESYLIDTQSKAITPLGSVELPYLIKATLVIGGKGNNIADMIWKDVNEKRPLDSKKPDMLIERQSPFTVKQELNENGTFKPILSSSSWGSPSFNNYDMATMLKLLFPLPTQDLKVGESIDVPFEMELSNVMERIGTLKMTLVNYVKIGEHTCAQLAVEMDIYKDRKDGTKAGRIEEISIKTSGVLYFDIKNRCLVSGIISAVMKYRSNDLLVRMIGQDGTQWKQRVCTFDTIIQVSPKDVFESVSKSFEPILFSTEVNKDNSPISPSDSFKIGTKRIYASFANSGSLKGFSKLITQWTNTKTKEVVCLDKKTLDPKAKFNYIWVDMNNGWQVGKYKVELFDGGIEPNLSDSKKWEKISEGEFIVEVNRKESLEWLKNGDELCKEEKYDDAIKSYDKALGFDPTNFATWYNRARVYSLKKDKDKTLSDLKKAVNLNMQCKGKARKDDSFQWLWEDEEFKELTKQSVKRNMPHLLKCAKKINF
jgi:tetratricopeptide (TPR) repeat protein